MKANTPVITTQVVETPWYKRSGWQAIWAALLGMLIDAALLALTEWHPTGIWAAVPPTLMAVLNMLRIQLRGDTSFRQAG